MSPRIENTEYSARYIDEGEATFARKAGRKSRSRSHRAIEELASFQTGQWLRQLTADLSFAKDLAADLPESTERHFKPTQLSDIKAKFDVIPAKDVIARISKLDRKFSGSGRERFVGLVIRQTTDFSKISKQRLPALGSLLIREVRLYRNTPKAFIEKPTPPEEVLSTALLNEALANVNLTVDEPGTVSAQLADSLGLTINGVSIRTKDQTKDGDIKYGPTILNQLLTILEKIRSSKSCEVFEKWVVDHCENQKKAREVLTFLTVLVNFTCFFDTKSQLELFKPPVVQGRDREFLINPLIAMERTLRHVGHKLYHQYRKTLLREEFREVLSVMGIRYRELYNDAHRASLFTSNEEALIPKPPDFAKLAAIIAKGRIDYNRTALGLVKLAESTGVYDLQPLLELLKKQPELREKLILEAQRYGLLPDTQATQKALKELHSNPWVDVVDIQDFSRIIKKGITKINFYAITGTFGFTTKGHVDLFEITQEHINSLPEEEGGQSTQSFEVLIPVTNISGIPDYQKNAARAGTIEQRVKVMLPQISGPALNREKVLITTLLQPDTTIHQGTLDRVKDTCKGITNIIWTHLRDAYRPEAIFDYSIKLVLGPDELEWVETNEGRKLASASQQTRKVKNPGGVVVIRRGYLLDILKNLDSVKSETGIETVILTPGTPYSSSTAAIERFHQKGDTNAVMAAARPLIRYYYSKDAIAAREPRELTAVYIDPEAHHAKSVTVIGKQLPNDPALILAT